MQEEDGIQDRILIRTCDISFEIQFQKALQPAVGELLQAFAETDVPLYRLRLGLTPKQRRLPVDLNRRYPPEQCLRFLTLERPQASTLDVEVQVAHRDLVSAALGYLLSLALSRNEGLLVHASAAIQDGKAYVFVGPSGAGKSTAVRSARDAVCLHDDRVALRRREGKWFAYGIPMVDNQKRPGVKLSAPVAGVYLLNKARSFCLSGVNAADAIKGLAHEVLMPFSDTDLRVRCADTVLDLVSDLGCQQLNFPLRLDVLSALAGQDRSA